MTQNKAVLSQLGLSAQEVVLIKSFFKLIKWVHEIYEFKEFDETIQTDVLLVNADSIQAMDYWRGIENKKIHNTLLVASKPIDIKNTSTLKRPINIRKFLVKLETISSVEATHEKYNDIVSESLKILVVDDSLSVRKYMEHKLPQISQNRLEISFAETGKQAARKVKDSIYDIVFLDVMMPGVDGYKVCKWIKANSIAEVVMLTSRGSRFDKVRGSMSGCDRYLTKPPQEAKLREIIEKRIQFVASNRNQMVKFKNIIQI